MIVICADTLAEFVRIKRGVLVVNIVLVRMLQAGIESEVVSRVLCFVNFFRFFTSILFAPNMVAL